MTATCQACVIKVPVVNNVFGAVGEPMGTCSNCHALACGHHGHRNSAPRFLCIECDTNLQAACAGWLAWRRASRASTSAAGDDDGNDGGDGGPGVVAARHLAETFMRADELERQLATSLERWFADRPGYARLEELIAFSVRDLATRFDEAALEQSDTLTAEVRGPQLWLALNNDERRLFAGAVALAQCLQLPAERLTPVLVELATGLGAEFASALPTKTLVVPDIYPQGLRYR